MLSIFLGWVSSSFANPSAKWAAIVAAAATIYWRIYDSGRSAERVAGAARDAAATKKRGTIDDQVSRMPDAAVRDQLRKWVRDENG